MLTSQKTPSFHREALLSALIWSTPDPPQRAKADHWQLAPVPVGSLLAFEYLVWLADDLRQVRLDSVTLS